MNNDPYIVTPCSHGYTTLHYIGETHEYPLRGVRCAEPTALTPPETTIPDMQTGQLLHLNDWLNHVASIVADEIESRTGERP